MLTTRSIYPKTFPTTTTRSASSDKLQRLYIVADFYFFFHNHLSLLNLFYLCNAIRYGEATPDVFWALATLVAAFYFYRSIHLVLRFCFIFAMLWRGQYWRLYCQRRGGLPQIPPLCAKVTAHMGGFFIQSRIGATFHSPSPRNRRV